METKEIIEAIKLARSKSKPRKFKQSFDISINFKELDLKNPAQKLKDSILLPHGHGKPVKAAAFADGVVAEAAKKAGITTIIDKAGLQRLVANKKEAKKLGNNFDFFIAQPDLMAEVGKNVGAVLGPRNKMPQPVPPNAPIDAILKRFEKVVNVRMGNLPIINCRVGLETLTDEQIAANIDAVVNALVKKAPKHEQNIKNVYVKTTMGASVKIGAAQKEGGEQK